MDEINAEERLRALGRAARAEVEAGLDVDAEIRALDGRTPTDLTVRDRRTGSRSPSRVWLAAAAAAVVAVGIWFLGNDDTTIQTADPETTLPTLTTVAPSTEPVSTTVAPSPTTTEPTVSTTSPTTATTATPTTATPASTVPVTPAPEVPVVVWRDLDWEGTGIEGSCVRASLVCTQVVHAADGSPISYEARTRVLTRHGRPELTVTLPEAYGDAGFVVHAGPDDVVYLAVAPAVPEELAVDVVAVTLADGDAGREIGRWDGVANAVGDSELVPTRAGLVNVNCCGPDAVRPDPGAEVLVPWLNRDGQEITSTTPTISVEIAYPDLTVRRLDPFTGGTRSWTYQPAGDWMPRGMPRIVATFDGGFLAAEYGSGGTSVARGFANGTVVQLLLDDSVLFVDSIDPTGRFLLGDGTDADGWFVRVDPFPNRVPRPADRASIDVEAGTVTLPDLSGMTGDWLFDPVAFADAVRGPLTVNELRTIDAEQRSETEWLVTVTTSNFFDDSVFADRWELALERGENGRLSFVSGTWANSCQPGRGHQDFRAALCT